MEMEPWATRIHTRMTELGLQQNDLAKACGIKESSVSGWFGKGSRPTRMLSGDNLVHVAKRLGVTPEWIITGKEAVKFASDQQSHSVRLDPDMIAETHKALRELYHDNRRIFNIEDEPARFLQVYQTRAGMSDEPSQDEWIAFGRKLAVLVPQGATKDGREDGVPTQGTGAGKQPGGIRRKA